MAGDYSHAILRFAGDEFGGDRLCGRAGWFFAGGRVSVGGAAAFADDDFAAAERYLLKADKAGKLDSQGKDLLAKLPAEKKAWIAEQAIRRKESAEDDLPRVKLETNKGTIVIELFEN